MEKEKQRTTEAQKRAKKKYMEKFVEIKVRVTPEKRTVIQEHAQTMGESATTFINRAIDNQISQDRRKGPSEAVQGPLGNDGGRNGSERRYSKGGAIMALPAKQRRYTFADVFTWDEDERAEIIDGEAVMMAPPPSRAHQEISGGLFWQLRYYLRGKKCKVYAAPFAVRLFEEDGDSPEDVDTMVEPDISIVCDPSKLDKHGCKGTPDMVIEILSPSTRRHDRLTKFNLYQRAGVREYWIVDPTDKSVQVFTLEDGHYAAKDFGAAGDKVRVNILEDCVIDLSEVFPE